MSNKKLCARMLYLILWGGALLIAAAMIFIDYRQQNSDKEMRYNYFNTKYASGDGINDLMLVASELTIEEKKAFINLFLKQANGNNAIAVKNYEKRNDVYKNILQRKMNKEEERSDEDFSVRPVPK